MDPEGEWNKGKGGGGREMERVSGMEPEKGRKERWGKRSGLKCGLE